MSDQKQINEIVWRACDTFRGAIDPSQYKDYILVMLFLKYLSDLHKETLQGYTTRYAGDADRIQRAMARERFVLPDESAFDQALGQHADATCPMQLDGGEAAARLEVAQEGRPPADAVDVVDVELHPHLARQLGGRVRRGVIAARRVGNAARGQRHVHDWRDGRIEDQQSGRGHEVGVGLRPGALS